MSDIFASALKPQKKDNTMKYLFIFIFLAFVMFSVAIGSTMYFFATHIHEIAHAAGSVARSAADGYGK